MSARPPVLEHWSGWLATGFGVGLSPHVPGTVGSVAALLPWFALRELPLFGYLLVVLLVFVLGTWAAGQVITRIGREDPGMVVIDEFVGLWIALILLPDGWLWPIAGLLVFRVFDILKPWPVSWADRRLKGGFGAMADDVLAGLYALVVLQIAADLLA